MNKAYNKITWQNKPSTATPLNQTNLNEMSNALDTIDDRVIALDSGKVGSVTVTNTLQTGDTIATITVDGTATNIKSAQVEVDEEPSATSANPLQNKAIYEMLNNLLPEGSESGNPISIDDASGLDAKACSVDLLPIQDLSQGEPSPTNICPISGRTEVSIKRVGINQWDEDWETGSINANTGEPTADNTRVRSKNFIRVKPNAEYYALLNVQVFGYDKNYSYIGIAHSAVTGGTFTTSNNCYYIKFRTPNTYGGTYNNDLGVNYPSTYTTYHTYQGETTEIEFPQTVYGGTLDVTNGKLTITHVALDVLNMSWLHNETLNAFYCYARNPNIAKGYNKLISNKYKTINTSYSTLQNGEICGSNGTQSINIKDDRFDNLNDFLTSLSDLQIVYELETPIELTLTPEEISLLKGNNVISTDGNNINLIYSKKL